MDFIISCSPDKPQASVSGADLFILILLSYVTGIVLTGFCVFWDAASIFILERAPFCTTLNLASAATCTQRWNQVSVSIDQVSITNDTVGRILVKAMAEVPLCQNLVTGLIVLACIGSFSGGTKFYAFQPYYHYYLLSFCSLFCAMLFRQAMFLGRVMDCTRIFSSTHKLTKELRLCRSVIRHNWRKSISRLHL
ncbi:hypothetical protein F6476_22770 [Pseudomonas umsongensis]|uniref:hypothetical protein n=1 Tax=Pseudomonas umsongensis TaxID=198618 RepID=UPI001243AFE7|nr:hypothetical protein [Pseudomonas umsongensis]QFG31794.1 hypothetical protein F6476_22770 [Pseudomonas umsongensis]